MKITTCLDNQIIAFWVILIPESTMVADLYVVDLYVDDIQAYKGGAELSPS